LEGSNGAGKESADALIKAKEHKKLREEVGKTKAETSTTYIYDLNGRLISSLTS
jgi:hypothetical protein